ncbi:hypothetical protein EAH_00064630, partial [Eimeria acervulina]
MFLRAAHGATQAVEGEPEQLAKQVWLVCAALKGGKDSEGPSNSAASEGSYGEDEDRQTKEEEDPYINNEDVKRILGRESSGEGGSRWSDGASGRDEGKPGEEGDYMRPDEVMTTAGFPTCGSPAEGQAQLCSRGSVVPEEYRLSLASAVVKECLSSCIYEEAPALSGEPAVLRSMRLLFFMNRFCLDSCVAFDAFINSLMLQAVRAASAACRVAIRRVVAQVQLKRFRVVRTADLRRRRLASVRSLGLA